MSNLYLVKHETHIDDLMKKNQNKLIILLFSTNNPQIVDQENTINLKKFIKHELSIRYKDVVIIYINLSDFMVTDNKYTSKFTKLDLPVTLFILNTDILAKIANTSITYLDDTLVTIKQRLDSLGIKPITQPAPQPSVTINMPNIQTPPKPTEIVAPQPAVQPVTQPAVEPAVQPVAQPTISTTPQLDTHIIQQQLLNQRKLEEIERLKKVYMVNELEKIRKAKEEQENHKTESE